MPYKYKRKFTIEHYKPSVWHIGAHFCIDPDYPGGKTEIYFALFLGRHDFLIGLLNIL